MALANVTGYDRDLGIATIGDTFNIVLDADESSAATVSFALWNNDPTTGTRFFQVTYDGTTTAITNATTFSAAGTALTVTNDARVSGSLGVGVAASGTAGEISASGNIRISNSVVGGWSGLWLAQATPAAENYVLLSNGTSVIINAPTGGTIISRINNATVATLDTSNFLLAVGGAGLVRAGVNADFGSWSSVVNVRSAAVDMVFYTGSTIGTQSTTGSERVRIAQSTGAVTIAQWLNVGATTLATAQGDISAGVTRTWTFKESTGIMSIVGTTATMKTAIGELTGATTFQGIAFGNVTGVTTGTYSLLGDGTNTYVSAATGGTAFFRINNATVFEYDATEITVNESGSATIDFRVESDTQANAIFVDASTNGVGFQQSAPLYPVDVGASLLSGTQASAVRSGLAGTFASAAALTYDAYNLAVHTVTLTGTTGMTAACAVAGVRLGIVSFTDSSAITVDNGATLYVAGAVAQLGSVTITNKYAIFSDAGLNRFDGDVVIGAAATADSANLYVTGKVSMSGECEINGDLNHDGSNVGFYGVAPAARQDITGSRANTEQALADLLASLELIGLITNSTTP